MISVEKETSLFGFLRFIPIVSSERLRGFQFSVGIFLLEILKFINISFEAFGGLFLEQINLFFRIPTAKKSQLEAIKLM